MHRCLCEFESDYKNAFDTHQSTCKEFLESDEGHRQIEIVYHHDHRVLGHQSSFRIHRSLGQELSEILLKLEYKSTEIFELESKI